MDPQQELFTALLLQLKEAFPGKVYDGFLHRKTRRIRSSIWQTVS